MIAPIIAAVFILGLVLGLLYLMRADKDKDRSEVLRQIPLPPTEPFDKRNRFLK